MKDRLQFLSIPKKYFSAGQKARNGTSVWNVPCALAFLKCNGRKRNVEGMARFGIRAKKVYGVSKPVLDEIAKRIGMNHALGLKLWATGIHDARLLGMLISDPRKVTASQMEKWVRNFDNWDLCDGTCCHLFVDAKPAWQKTFEWSLREKEFEKRAGFALAAFLAVHDKTASDARFRRYLLTIERESWDQRNFVRKAVNWALRNIGKRNIRLNGEAIRAAEKIRQQGTSSARWIAADALRELKSLAVQSRLLRRRETRA
jgi:3-methyladenine DNA glycosylase AlkD